jgi:signal transduction histidine kinase
VSFGPVRFAGPGAPRRPALRSILLVVAALGGAVGVDVALLPGRNFAIVYALPILVAALCTSAPVVGVTAALAIALDLLDAQAEHVPLADAPVTVLALLVVALLALRLSLQREETLRLRDECARHANEAEGQAERMGDFLRMAAHDIAQPLGIASLHLQALQRALDRPDLAPARERAETVAAALGRTDQLIRDLVEAARVEFVGPAPRPEEVDLPAFTRALLDQLRGVLDVERVRVEADGPVRVVVDPVHLQRILGNLVGNALKYSPEGSPVWVRIRPAGATGEVAVVDRGIGLAPEEAARVFERGYRAEAARAAAPGSGLGLFITRGLVEANRGRVWVDSRPGEGSAFHVSLPAPPRRASPAAPATGTRSDPVGDGRPPRPRGDASVEGAGR